MEQENNEAMRRLLSACVPGDILVATAAEISPEGCVLVSNGARLFLPRDRIARSPLCGPERLRPGQTVPCVVWKIDRDTKTITVSHRELLGTFDELAQGILPGSRHTARIAGSGLVELAPNLVARVLADAVGVEFCEAVVFRVAAVDFLRGEIDGEIIAPAPKIADAPFTYYITNGRIKHWSFHAPQHFFCTDETFFTA
jgi:small subunit ribosomal protein S1